VKILSRLKALFDEAFVLIERQKLPYHANVFYYWVGSERAATAILNGSLREELDHYKSAFLFFADILGDHGGRHFQKRGMRALLMDLEEYHVLLPSKLEKKERKIRKEKLSSKRPESTPLKRGENPCTLAPSEVVKEERVEGKWHWENGTGRNKAEIRQGIILDLLRKHPEMTEPELTVGLKRSKRISASGIRVSLRTVKRDIAHLEAIGLLHREGTDFDGRWRVTEE
jgi:hypothetical protein